MNAEENNFDWETLKDEQKQMNDYLERALNKMKLDPQYELKLKFGKLLIKLMDDFTPSERKGYDELKIVLTYKG